MTVYWITAKGRFTEYKQNIFYLDDGSTLEVFEANVLEYGDAYKIYDDTSKQIIILWKSKLRKIEFKADNYESLKQDKINEIKEMSFK